MEDEDCILPFICHVLTKICNQRSRPSPAPSDPGCVILTHWTDIIIYNLKVCNSVQRPLMQFDSENMFFIATNSSYFS